MPSPKLSAYPIILLRTCNMPSSRSISSLGLLVACVLAPSCAHIHASGAPNRLALLRLVREYGQNRPPDQPTPPVSVALSADHSAGSAQPALETEEDYIVPLKASLNAWDFAQLEKQAQEARVTKARLRGGAWKLYMFYDAVTLPPAGSRASDADWANHFQTLNQWKVAQPASPTARNAIAESYVNYAWKARGSGYANSVSDNSWDLYNDRIELASSALADAVTKKEKCPYWYEVTQQVALAQGWTKSQARQLFDQAAAFEPGYYHFYREYANFILPKWYGEPGDAESFATEVANRVGGQEGDFLYFEVASVVMCKCSPRNGSVPAMSWPRIQQGYIALDHLYGVSDVKLNRYALMAYVMNQKPDAQEALAKIGDAWVKDVWWTNDDFQGAKTWAATP